MSAAVVASAADWDLVPTATAPLEEDVGIDPSQVEDVFSIQPCVPPFSK